MHDDQIIARAQQEVAVRRMAAAEQRWNGAWRWLLPTLVLAVLLAFFAAPVPLPRKLLLAMSGVCSLRPGHSYFAGGVQLPIEARMMGIYGGFLLTLPMLLFQGRGGARRLGSKHSMILLALLFASMLFDGINSTLAEIGLPHLYTPTNALRLLTGLLSGMALAVFLVWLVGRVAMPYTAQVQRSVVHAPWELGVPLALNAVFALLVAHELPSLYYPLALISVAGVVMVLTSVALLVILSLSGLAGKIKQLHQIVEPGALALLAAFAVLASTAALRAMAY